MPIKIASINPLTTLQKHNLYFFHFFKEQPKPLAKNQKQARYLIACLCILANVMVEVNGIEPMTSCLQSMRSPN